jgi:hypothetical protein
MIATLPAVVDIRSCKGVWRLGENRAGRELDGRTGSH